MKIDRNTKALVLFLVLAYLLHVVALLICQAVPLLYLQLLVPWTPNISAILVVVFYLKEEAGVRRLANGWTRWRVSPKWYLLAFAPMIVYFLSAGIYLMIGSTPPSTDSIPSLGFSFPVFAIIAIFTGATGEELGWRGFALPRLQRHYSALVSSLILGLYWGIWHIPSWIIAGSPFTIESTLFFLASTVLNSIIVTCIFNNTRGSVLLASIHHWSENVWSQYVVSCLGLVTWDALIWIKTPIVTILALILIIALGPERLSKASSLESGPLRA